MAEFKQLLDVLVERVGVPVPEGCDAWGMRSVWPDLRSSRGFRWPFPGGWAEAPGPILNHGGSCPIDVGDGICVATTPLGMRSGGIPATTVLLTAHASADVLGDSDPGKVRVRRAYVVDLIDLAGIARSGAYLRGAYLSGAYLSGAYLRGADLSGADLSGAYLSGADLSRADLSRADLSGAYLSRADLDGWERGPDGFARRVSGA